MSPTTHPRKNRFFILVLFLVFAWTSSAQANGVFRFPLFYVPSSLDPVKDELVETYYIVQQVYDGLVAFDSNLRVVPGLAESWKISRDGKTYSFQLRKDVRFHNGKVVTSEDVVASLTRLLDPENVTSNKEYLYRIKGAREYRDGLTESIEGIRALNPSEVLIEMVEPYAPFLSVLAMPIAKIVPAEMARDEEHPLSQKPVGTGPFIFESWTDNTISLVANDDYFTGAPLLKGIQFIFYPGADRERAFQDFKAGTLDGCPLPGSAKIDELKKEGYQVLVRPRLALLFYGINVTKPPLNNLHFRKALFLALDRNTLSEEVMGSKYPPAEQILPRGMPGYSPGNALAVYDPVEAKRSLEESGYLDTSEIRELVLASASHSDLAKKELELYRRNLADLGIVLKPLFVDSWEEFKNGLTEGRYDLYRYAYSADIPDPDDLFPGIVETGASHNFSGYSNPKVDNLIEKARSYADLSKRIALYREAERMVLEDAALIPVIYLSSQVVFQKNVRNIDLPATGTPYLPLSKVKLADGT